MKVLFSAAESSSDIHAARILKSLIQDAEKRGEIIEAYGIGGPELRAIAGFNCVFPAESLRAMGFTEIIGKFATFRRAFHALLKIARQVQPDLIMTFDYPDFHFRFMRALQNESWLHKTLRVCGIPPKVWVWRAGRVKQIRALYDGVWVIFPFERDFYEKLGIPVIYTGNPLIAALPLMKTEIDAQIEVGARDEIDSGQIPVAVFPGSRTAELKWHLPLIPEALERFSYQISKKIIALVPIVDLKASEQIKRALPSTDRVTYRFFAGQSALCLKASRIGLIKSGTSTLEATVLGCSPVIFYKTSLLSEWIFRLVSRYLGPVGLPNILLGIRDRSRLIYPEILGREATPESLASALTQTFHQLNVQTDAHKMRLRDMLVPGAATVDVISVHTVSQMLLWLKQKRHMGTTDASCLRAWAIQSGSCLWSLLNALRRKLHFKRSHQMLNGGKSILIGNLQAGGTGKTPVVIGIATLAHQAGLRVGILSRGYGRSLAVPVWIEPNEPLRKTQEIGDENVEIQEACPFAVIGIDSNRLEMDRRMLHWSKQNQTKLDLVIADDGFQNLKFHAGASLICMTSRQPHEVFYRDFYSALRFSDYTIRTKGLGAVPWKAGDLPKKPIWLVCGVGDPREVRQFYEALGVVVRKLIALPDHSALDKNQIKKWQDSASADGSILAVTQKDFVKLRESSFQEGADNNLLVLRRTPDLSKIFKQLVDRLQLT